MFQQECEPGKDCDRANGFEEISCGIEPIVGVPLLRSGVLDPGKNLLRVQKNENAKSNGNQIECECVPVGFLVIGN